MKLSCQAVQETTKIDSEGDVSSVSPSSEQRIARLCRNKNDLVIQEIEHKITFKHIAN